MKYISCPQDSFIRTVTLEELGCEYFIINSTKHLNKHLDSIEKLINDFNSYISWDKMFTISDVKDRIKNGEVIIIVYYNSSPVGYIFTNKGWISNLFISKLTNKPPKTFLSLTNKAIEYSIEKYNAAAWEAEDWNKPMFYVSKECGCKRVRKSLKSNLVI